MTSVEDVDRYLGKLKTGKAAGSDGITAQHFISSHHIRIAKMLLLFA